MVLVTKQNRMQRSSPSTGPDSFSSCPTSPNRSESHLIWLALSRPLEDLTFFNCYLTIHTSEYNEMVFKKSSSAEIKVFLLQLVEKQYMHQLTPSLSKTTAPSSADAGGKASHSRSASEAGKSAEHGEPTWQVIKTSIIAKFKLRKMSIRGSTPDNVRI